MTNVTVFKKGFTKKTIITKRRHRVLIKSRGAIEEAHDIPYVNDVQEML